MDLLTGGLNGKLLPNVGILKSILDQQLEHEKNGDYVEAEKCRVKYEN